jgi:hypothetical protein
MARYYKTGELLDVMGPEHVAECVQGICKGAKLFYQNIKDRGHVLMMKYPEGEIAKFHPTYEYKHCKWKILPNYVDVAEAMRNVKAGRTVIFHGEGKEHIVLLPASYEEPFDQHILSNYSLKQLIEGKWSVMPEID